MSTKSRRASLVSTVTKLAYVFSVIARKNDEAISPRHVGSLAADCFLVPRRNDVIIIFGIVLIMRKIIFLYATLSTKKNHDI